MYWWYIWNDVDERKRDATLKAIRCPCSHIKKLRPRTTWIMRLLQSQAYRTAGCSKRVSIPHHYSLYKIGTTQTPERQTSQFLFSIIFPGSKYQYFLTSSPLPMQLPCNTHHPLLYLRRFAKEIKLRITCCQRRRCSRRLCG